MGPEFTHNLQKVSSSKDSLIVKEKAVHATKAKPGIHSSLPMGRQVFSQPQESKAPSHIMAT